MGDATYQQMLDNVPSTGEVEAAAGGRRLTIFAANDYLGLSAHPAVRRAPPKSMPMRILVYRGGRVDMGGLAPEHTLPTSMAYR